ncbi:MAG: aminopeptidase P family protein [Pyrinomonadaceae bacterium]
MKKNFTTLIFLSLLFALATPVLTRASDKFAPPTMFVTPPAPQFTDAERQAELARRRAAVFSRMQPNSLMILWSAAPRNYAGDVDFLYRQENNLYYLTSLKQKSATLVLVKNADGAAQEFLFLPKRNPAAETWNGKMYSNEDAARISGLKTIIDAAELPVFLQSLKDKKDFTAKTDVKIGVGNLENVYLLLPEDERDGDGMAEFNRENDFAKTLTNYKIINARAGATDIFGDLRQVKSAYELKLLQHAIDITTEAQERAMATAKNAKWEYETQAEIEYIFRKRNADYWGYPSIVGCGENATTLHYEEAQGAVRPGDLLLMDVGAEYDHYTADVTRTFPVNGKFSNEQADIYQIVYDAQEAAAKTIKPGANSGDPGKAAVNVLKQGLAKLGLITAPDATVEFIFNGQKYTRPQYTIWFMHGWGHWLGMNVHDVGAYGVPLKAGMVTTNEPGIYVRADALDYLPDTPANRDFIAKVKPAFEKYKNIGVRIEDDMLVTDTGAEWLTKNLPRSISDIEAFIAKNSMPSDSVEPH